MQKPLFFPGCTIVYSMKKNGSISNRKDLQHVCKKTLPDFSREHIAFAKLSHGSSIAKITSKNWKVLHKADALITCTPLIALSFVVADCVPIVLFDSKRKCLGLIHGGWKSLVQNIVPLAMKEMQIVFQSNPKNISAWIGPFLRVCCNTTTDVPFQAEFSSWKQSLKKTGKIWYIDLQLFIKNQLLSLGISGESIIDSNLCTYHLSNDFFSYRRSLDNNNPSENGRFAVIAYMQ